MNKINLRKATPTDKTNIANVIAYSFEKEFAELIKDMNKIALALKDGVQTEKFFVAEKQGEIVGVIACTDCSGRAVKVNKSACRKHLGLIRGFIGARVFAEEFMTPLKFPPTTGFIEFVGVLENARREGVATKMLRYAIDNTDYGEYMLDVLVSNTSARECYKKFGFTEVESDKRVKQSSHAKLYMKYSQTAQ